MNALEVSPPSPDLPEDSMRASVRLWSESIEEKVEFTTWLNTWRKKLSYVSHDYGDGAALHLFDLEGPKEAFSELSPQLLTITEWTEHGLRRARPASRPPFAVPPSASASS
jgi:hypothetical protein